MMSFLFVESLRIVGREKCLYRMQVLKVHIFMLVYKEARMFILSSYHAFYSYFISILVSDLMKREKMQNGCPLKSQMSLFIFSSCKFSIKFTNVWINAFYYAGFVVMSL